MNTGIPVSNIVLWILVAGLALVVMALARQIGILHERVAPAGALLVGGDPKVGEQAPVLAVSDIDGDEVQIGAARDYGKSTLVFFLSPNCPVCKTLLPVLKSSRKSESDWLNILLASDGGLAELRNFIKAADLGGFTYLLSSELGITYLVGKLPYAILLDEAVIIRSKGLVNSREHIESLFEAKERGVASVQEYFGQQSN